MERHRIEWVDLAKGITILSVIIGHTDKSLLRHLIFSFHMPFFFVMSGYTFRESTEWRGYWNHFGKGFKQLVLPAFVLVGFSFVYNWLIADQKLDLGVYIRESCYSLFFFSGVSGDFLGHHIYGIGVAWFLVSFFLAKELYDFMQMKLDNWRLLLVVVFLSVFGVWITRVSWLPLSFDISLATLIFLYFGEWLRKLNFEKKVDYIHIVFNGVMWLGGAILLFILCKNSMALAVRRYLLFPLCYVVAMLGTLAMMNISVMVDKKSDYWKKFAKPIYFAGESSLYVLYVHILDYIWMPFFDNWIVNLYLLAGVRCVIDVVLAMLLVKVWNKHSLYIKI